MKRLVLKARAYGSFRGRILHAVESEISEMTRELDVSLSRLKTDNRDRIIIEVNGEDEEFVANVLSKEYGTVIATDAISVGSVYYGHFVDVGKVGYGLYVDIGITTPLQVDTLIPLFRLREQLSMEKTSLRAIAKTVVFVDNLPVNVSITSIDNRGPKIEAELAESFLNQLNRWVEDDHERLLILGCTRKMLDDALKKSKHLEDIYRVERLGSFEYSLRCKRSTRASGILAAIGPKLRGVPMHLFIPDEVGEKYHAKT
ncbi:MAG: DUF2110 family protein [Candidatus Thorarchaeota archaeon]